MTLDMRGKELQPGDWVLHIQSDFKRAGNLTCEEGIIMSITNGTIRVKKKGKDRVSIIYASEKLIKYPQGY